MGSCWGFGAAVDSGACTEIFLSMQHPVQTITGLAAISILKEQDCLLSQPAHNPETTTVRNRGSTPTPPQSQGLKKDFPKMIPKLMKNCQ
eukprot:3639657-Amphidinium_carterae.1